MSKYIFAPAGAASSHNTLLKLGVEYIGSKQSGFGSSWAKGKRYIKANLVRSEERRVGKECRSRWSPYH